jgi:hypothetical protein
VRLSHFGSFKAEKYKTTELNFGKRIAVAFSGTADIFECVRNHEGATTTETAKPSWWWVKFSAF